jgi:hypothetical protein
MDKSLQGCFAGPEADTRGGEWRRRERYTAGTVCSRTKSSMRTLWTITCCMYIVSLTGPYRPCMPETLRDASLPQASGIKYHTLTGDAYSRKSKSSWSRPIRYTFTFTACSMSSSMPPRPKPWEEKGSPGMGGSAVAGPSTTNLSSAFDNAVASTSSTAPRIPDRPANLDGTMTTSGMYLCVKAEIVVNDQVMAE